MTGLYLNKLLCRILIFCVITLTPTLAYAQSEALEQAEVKTETSSEPNAIQKIVESSRGNVEIVIDDVLMEKILTPPTAHKKPSTQNKQTIRPGLNRISGYRIQVFSDGRNQASLESRARARGNAITAKFPKYRGQVYTFSSAPNWYTRVGNFQTASEANEALVELRRNFPSFADEMRVVKCQIVVLK